MKFIHISDVRLRTNRQTDRHWEYSRSLEILDTLKKVLNLAEETDTQLLLITGGLFDHQPVTRELEELNRLFATTPQIRILILAGKGDMIRKSSPVKSFSWAENVTYILSSGAVKISYPPINTTVYVCSNGEDDSMDTAKSWSMFRRNFSRDCRIRIAAAYEPDMEKAEEVFSGTDMCYVALGGSSSRKEIEQGRICYSGALEPSDISETGAHGVLQGIIGDVSGKIESLEFVPLAAASYISLVVQVSPDTEPESLSRRIEEEIRRRGRKNIYRLRLIGKKDPDREYDLSELKEIFRLDGILDETEPKYDYRRLFEEHAGDLLGQYISSFCREESNMTPLDRQALYYGIEAMLKTQEKETT